MTPRDLADIFLVKARQDLDAAVALAASPPIADEIVGFLAQQCVEKSLKAVLEAGGTRFEKTHNIDELLDLLKTAKSDLPEWLEEASILTPFAVRLRYSEIEATEKLDRPTVCALIERTLTWASGVVAQFD